VSWASATLLHGVGQGHHLQRGGGPQLLGRTRNLRVRRQRAHPVDHLPCVVGTDLDPLALGEHGERRALRGAEVDVVAGDTPDEGHLQHQGEPLRPQRRVAQRLRERLVERAEVEKGFVDVERDDGGHG